jgi:TatD DNase family protein
MKIFDLHCHVDLMPDMLQFAKDISDSDMMILSMTTTPKAYEKELIFFKNNKAIIPALGLHPQLVKERFNELKLVEKYLPKSKYIGEVGLDFNSQFYATKEQQIIVFDTIIGRCTEYKGKIISIHSVKSAKHVLDILEKYNCCNSCKCILHWYSGDVKQFERAVKMGCFFSVNLKMLESANGKKIVKKISSDRILVESDAPFINDVKTVMSLKDKLSETIKELLVQRPDLCLEQLYENSIQIINE